MLIKRTSKNQLTLPVSILNEAGIGAKDMYFEIHFDAKKGVIFLQPVQVTIEEKIPASVIERFEKTALEHEAGDVHFDSPKKADGYLKKLMKK